MRCECHSDIICIIAWGDSGRTQHATPHAPSTSHRLARALHQVRRSSGCMHARGSTPHPRRHRRHTNTNSNPTHHHQKHTGRAGGHSRNRYTEQGTRPPKRTVDAQQISPNPCLLPKGTRNEPIGPKPETPHHYKGAPPQTSFRTCGADWTSGLITHSSNPPHTSGLMSLVRTQT